MTEGKDKIIELESGIYKKLKEISDVSNIDIQYVTQASFLHGFTPFWLLLQKYYKNKKQANNANELMALKENIVFSSKIFQEFDKYEKKFNKESPFGTFANIKERNAELLRFVEESTKLKTDQKEKLVAKSTKRPKEKKQSEKKHSRFKKLKTKLNPKLEKISAYRERKLKNFADLSKFVVLIELCFLANYFILAWINHEYSILFDFGYHWQYHPYFTFLIPIIIFFIILISSLLIGVIYYSIVNLPKRRKKKSGKIT